MKECPKCGHIDPPYWRAPPHYPELDYVRPEDLAEMDPDLFKQLRPGLPIEQSVYVYRMTETGKWVYRVWLPIWKAFGPGGWSQFRKTKMFDSAGRVRKDSWARLLKAKANMARYKKDGPHLENWISRSSEGKRETMKAPVKPKTSSLPLINT